MAETEKAKSSSESTRYRAMVVFPTPLGAASTTGRIAADEIGTLQRDLNSMVSKLQETIASLQESRGESRKNERMLRTIIDVVPSMIFVKSADGLQSQVEIVNADVRDLARRAGHGQDQAGDPGIEVDLPAARQYGFPDGSDDFGQPVLHPFLDAPGEYGRRGKHHRHRDGKSPCEKRHSIRF